METFQIAGAALAFAIFLFQLFDRVPILRRFAIRLFHLPRGGWRMFEEWRVWHMHRPRLKITQEPLNITLEKIKGTTRFRCMVNIGLDFQSRDKGYKTQIYVEKIKLVIMQGYGLRKREVTLERDTNRYKKTSFALNPKDLVHEEVFLEGFGNTEIPKTTVDFSKSFKWEINGIEVQVFGLSDNLRELKCSRRKK